MAIFSQGTSCSTVRPPKRMATSLMPTVTSPWKARPNSGSFKQRDRRWKEPKQKGGKNSHVEDLF